MDRKYTKPGGGLDSDWDWGKFTSPVTGSTGTLAPSPITGSSFATSPITGSSFATSPITGTMEATSTGSPFATSPIIMPLASSTRNRSTRVPGKSPGAKYEMARYSRAEKEKKDLEKKKKNRQQLALTKKKEARTTKINVQRRSPVQVLIAALSKRFTIGGGEIPASDFAARGELIAEYNRVMNHLSKSLRDIDPQPLAATHCRLAQNQVSPYMRNFTHGDINHNDFRDNLRPYTSVDGTGGGGDSISALVNNMTNGEHKERLKTKYGLLASNDITNLLIYNDNMPQASIYAIHPAGTKKALESTSHTYLRFQLPHLEAVTADHCLCCNIPNIGTRGYVNANAGTYDYDGTGGNALFGIDEEPYGLLNGWKEPDTVEDPYYGTKYEHRDELTHVFASNQASYCDHWAAMIIGSALGVFINHLTTLDAIIWAALCKTCNTLKGNMVTLKFVTIKLANGKFLTQLAFDEPAARVLINYIFPLGGIVTRKDEGNPIRRDMTEMYNSWDIPKRQSLHAEILARFKAITDHVANEANPLFVRTPMTPGYATQAQAIQECLKVIEINLGNNRLFKGGTIAENNDHDDMDDPGMVELHDILSGSETYKKKITDKIINDFKESNIKLTSKQLEEIVADATNTTSARKIIMDINLYLTMINYNQELDEEWIISMISPMQTALESSDHSNINEYTIHFFNNLLKLYNANPEHYPGEKLRMCINTIDQLQKQYSETNKAQSSTPTTVFTSTTPELSQEDKEHLQVVLKTTLAKLKETNKNLDEVTKLEDYAAIKVFEPDFTIGGVIMLIDYIEKNPLVMKEYDTELINSIKTLNAENLNKIQTKNEDKYYKKGTVFNPTLVKATAGGKPKKVGTKKKRDKQSKRISHGKKNKAGTPKNRKNKKNGTRKNKKSKK